MHSDTSPRENIVAFSQWWLGDANNRKPIQVKGGKRSGKNVVAHLAGIDSRELAETVIGQQIAVPRSDLPALDSEEYYWTDLIGCEVSTVQGVVIGPVERLFETGANVVMVVTDQRKSQNAAGQKGNKNRNDRNDRNDQQVQPLESESRTGDILIPWIRPSVITSVDLQERQIVVDWDPDF